MTIKRILVATPIAIALAGCGGSTKTVTATRVAPATTATAPQYSSTYPPGFEQQWQTSCNENPQQYASATARRTYCTCALNVLEGAKPYVPGETGMTSEVTTEVLRKCAGIG